VTKVISIYIYPFDTIGSGIDGRKKAKQYKSKSIVDKNARVRKNQSNVKKTIKEGRKSKDKIYILHYGKYIS